MSYRPEALSQLPKELLPKFPQSEKEPRFYQDLFLIASEIRRSAFNTILKAGTGHVGASSSSVEMFTALYFGGILKYDHINPRHPDRDRVLLRGHLGPTRYKIFSLIGWLDESRLDYYRRLGGLPGHEEMNEVPGIDITPTGSLGMELSYGAGCAFAAKRLGKDFKTFVFLGDGEEQEGNVSEAARHIASMRLDNLICVMDKNGSQLSRRTSESDVGDVRTIWEGYGWEVGEIVDGNDIVEVMNVFQKTREDKTDKPIMIVSHTVKGLGVPGAIQNFCGYHTVSSCGKDDLPEAIRIQERIMTELGYSSEQIKHLATAYAKNNKLVPQKEQGYSNIEINIQPHPDFSNDLKKGLEYYRKKLVEFFKAEKDVVLYSMTADLMRTDLVQMYGFDQDPIIHIDTGIREQHLIAMAYGLSLTDPSSRILINFAELTTPRAADQLGVVAISNGKMIILSEGGGLSGSKDGATHQPTSVPGIILTMPGMKMCEPADVRDAFNCLNQAFSNYTGPLYLRSHWRDTPLLPRSQKDLNNISFYEVGNCSTKPDLLLVSSGLTTQGALEAKTILEENHGMVARLINIVDLKSLDENFVELLQENAPVLTIYNGVESILRSVVASTVMQYPNKLPSKIEGHGFERGATGLLDELIPEFKFDGPGIIKVLKGKFPFLFENKLRTKQNGDIS